MSLSPTQLAAVSGAVASHLIPYTSMEVVDDTFFATGDFPPYATGAIGLKVYFGQPRHNNRVHSEVSIDIPWSEGADIIYMWKFMLPSDSPVDPSNRFWVITQCHDQPNPDVGETWDTYPSNSPPINISRGRISGQDLLSVSYGAPNPGNVGGLIPISTDTWYTMVARIKWSTGSDGSLLLTMNGTEVCSATGRNMHNAYQHYLKFGQYRDVNIEGTAWAWFDAVDIVEVGFTRTDRELESPNRDVAFSSAARSVSFSSPHPPKTFISPSRAKTFASPGRDPA